MWLFETRGVIYQAKGVTTENQGVNMRYVYPIIILILSLGIVNKIHAINAPEGVELVKVVDKRLEHMNKALIQMGCKENTNAVAKAILECSDKIKVKPLLIAALMVTESNFNIRARSSKGYVGLMQTPIATKEYIDVDVLLGCRILESKMRIAKGDMKKALGLYKGGTNNEARRQAVAVLALYKTLKQQNPELA
jgi:hypothetical protein